MSAIPKPYSAPSMAVFRRDGTRVGLEPAAPVHKRPTKPCSCQEPKKPKSMRELMEIKRAKEASRALATARLSKDKWARTHAKKQETANRAEILKEHPIADVLDKVCGDELAASYTILDVGLQLHRLSTVRGVVSGYNTQHSFIRMKFVLRWNICQEAVSWNLSDVQAAPVTGALLYSRAEVVSVSSLDKQLNFQLGRSSRKIRGFANAIWVRQITFNRPSFLPVYFTEKTPRFHYRNEPPRPSLKETTVRFDEKLCEALFSDLGGGRPDGRTRVVVVHSYEESQGGVVFWDTQNDTKFVHGHVVDLWTLADLHERVPIQVLPMDEFREHVKGMCFIGNMPEVRRWPEKVFYKESGLLSGGANSGATIGELDLGYQPGMHVITARINWGQGTGKTGGLNSAMGLNKNLSRLVRSGKRR